MVGRVNSEEGKVKSEKGRVNREEVWKRLPHYRLHLLVRTERK